MALDVVKFLVNKFVKSLVDLESDSLGITSIAIFKSVKSLIPSFKEIKDDMKEIDVMPEGCDHYSKLIDELYELNDAVAECRVFAHEFKELDKDLSRFNPFRFDFVKNMNTRLTTIKQKLKSLISSIFSSQVIGGDDQSTLDMKASHQEVSNPPEKKEVEVSSNILGFDEHAKRIEKLLLGGTSTNFTAIGVVGVAGVGKTTLVQKVLEMDGVRKVFSPILWLPFSSTREGVQQYSRFSFETCIVDKGGHLSDESIVGLDKISDRLDQLLPNKRFLVVLDDVCHQHINIEERLCSRLPKDSGGAVIVTSRLKQVTRKLVERENLILLESMDRDLWWRLFSETMDKYSTSVWNGEVKEEITVQFHGLPSVAKALAEIMSQPS